MPKMNGSTKRPAAGPDEPALSPSERPADRASALALDPLRTDVVLRHVPGRSVLVIGSGDPVLSLALATRASHVDSRSLDALTQTAEHPRYDVVLATNTVPHLGPTREASDASVAAILSTIDHALGPTGCALVEIANAASLWGAYHGLRHLRQAAHAGPLLVQTAERTLRFDTLRAFLRRLPRSLTCTRIYGLALLPQVVVARYRLFAPLIDPVNWWGLDAPIVSRLAAHLVLELRHTQGSPVSST